MKRIIIFLLLLSSSMLIFGQSITLDPRSTQPAGLQVTSDIALRKHKRETVNGGWPNYPRDNSSVVIFEGGGSLSGMADGQDGVVVYVFNGYPTGATTTGQLTIQHENSLSSAANRIMTPNGTDFPVGSGGVALIYDGQKSRWRVATPEQTGGGGSSPLGWGLTGNSGTNSASNFIGTSDAQPLIVKTNNSEKMRITSAGFVGVGISTPGAKFHIQSSDASVTPFSGSVLAIEDTKAAYLNILSGSNYFGGVLFGSSLGKDKGQIIYAPTSNEMSFRTNSLTRMTITGSGNTEFGDATYPGVKVLGDGNGSAGEIALYKDGSANGAIFITGSHGTGRGAAIYMKNSTTTTSLLLDADYNNTDRSRIRVDELEIVGGSDLAEYFSTPFESGKLEEGTVVSVSTSGKGDVVASNVAYDKRIVGVVSGANGIKTGLMLRQTESIADGAVPVALSGRVYVKAIGKIQAGDFLTTSNTEGFAMKVKSYRKAKGAIIGKALTDSDGNSGLVLVLLNAK